MCDESFEVFPSAVGRECAKDSCRMSSAYACRDAGGPQAPLGLNWFCPSALDSVELHYKALAPCCGHRLHCLCSNHLQKPLWLDSMQLKLTYEVKKHPQIRHQHCGAFYCHHVQLNSVSKLFLATGKIHLHAIM